MHGKVVKVTTAHREANYSRDTVKIRDDSRSTDERNIMDDSSSRIAGTGGKSATVEKTATFSRDTSNRSRNSQREH
jgi:hypothetical protein